MLVVNDLLPELFDGSELFVEESMGRYELGLLRTHVGKAAEFALKRRRRQITDFLAWIEDNAGVFGLPAKTVADLKGARKLSDDANRPLLVEVAPQVANAKFARPSALEKRLAWIASALRLSNLDAIILKLSTRAVLSPLFRELGNVTIGRNGDSCCFHVDALSALTGISATAISERLRRHRPLRQLGLVEDHRGGDFAPSGIVLRLARLTRSDPAGLERELFGRPKPASLEWADFSHLRDMRELAFDLLGGALKRYEPGIGVMLYGPPGTGKTEFAKTLARQLDAIAVFVGEADGENGEPTRTERIGHLSLVSALASRAGRAILVVDEADDIFTGVDESDHASRAGSKVFMNRLVEGCPAPTIWITNHPERLGPAILRRMTLALRFSTPGPALRRDMAVRLAQRRNVELDGGELELLVENETSPALMEAGLRAASLAGRGSHVAFRSMASLQTALTGFARPTPAPASITFDPILSSANCNLRDVADRVVQRFNCGQKALSFCLYGLPGTGKSAYARHLAKQLGLEVFEKRASDLLSMFLGESEKNIACAFREAADQGTLLIIDEADSLLRNRAGAVRSWEVTQVNEMLTWMERHPLPFVCTTNAMDSLDPATLRRFLFKIEFLPMTMEQARLAFHRSFGAEAPAGIERVTPLTPGDFALVARKAAVLGTTDPNALVGLLADEVASKLQGASPQIGFFA